MQTATETGRSRAAFRRGLYAVLLVVGAAIGWSPMFLDSKTAAPDRLIPPLHFAGVKGLGRPLAMTSAVKAGLRWSPAPPSTFSASPTHGRWQRYVLLPSSRSVCPERVATPLDQSADAISEAGALACSGQGADGRTVIRGSSTRLILDFGREVSGGLELRFGARAAPGTVSVVYSESLRYLSAHCDALGIEGLRIPAGAKVPRCPRSIAIHKGMRAWYDGHPRSGFRYVMLTIAPAHRRGRVEIVAAGLPDYTPLPQMSDLSARAVYKGWFLSSDDALNRYWFDGAYTAQVDTVAARQAGLFYEGIPGLAPQEPVMVDGAKRDRYIWYDLAGPKTLIPLLYGDMQTPKDTLLALGQMQTAEGFIPACRTPASFYGAPCDTAWTDATAWWLIALGEYWLWTGDTQFASGAYPAVGKALHALASCVEARGAGLIHACHGQATYDTASAGSAPSTYLNALYYRALRVGAQIARLSDRPADAGRYERIAARLRMSINRLLWDRRAQAYLCARGEAGCHSQDANVLPVVWGIASGPRASRALSYVKRTLWSRYGTRTGSPGMSFGVPIRELVANWISYFELQARIGSGDTADADSLLRRAWGYMYDDWKPAHGPQGSTAEPPSTTAWEHVDARTGAMFRGAQASAAHAWSAGATVAETTGLLGVEPVAGGFSSWRLQPHAEHSGLRWAEGEVPTSHGSLWASWRLTGAQLGSPRSFVLAVSAPAGTTGTVYVPLYGRVRKVIEDGRAADGVPAGGYLRIHVGGGRHTFAWG